MRVIAGSARRLLLKTLPGNDTRPTTDKIKETLFNILNFDLPGSCFLDLYAGSGAIGIEALSRGASHCTFVDNNAKAVSVIKENVAHTHFEGQSDIILSEAVSALRRLERSSEQYDFVFLDPPYNQGFEDSALRYLKNSGIINDNTQIIVEMSIKADIDHFNELGFSIDKVKSYKTNKHVFLRRKP